MSDPILGGEPPPPPSGGLAGPAELGGGAPPPPPPPLRPPYPWARLLYAIGFAFVAWAVFWVVILLLAPLHYITVALTGRPNEELQMMSLRAVHYLKELLGFITGAQDEKPFPLGPFPKD